MEDDGTVTLVIAPSQTSSVPFEVTVNTMDITAISKCNIIKVYFATYQALHKGFFNRVACQKCAPVLDKVNHYN